MPKLKLKLVDRNIDKQEDIINKEIANQLTIEYTSYAITIDGKNKVYLSTKDEAQDVVEILKKEYEEKYIDKLGIIQVYSEKYEDISTLNINEAKAQIEKEIKSTNNNSRNGIKVAKSNAKLNNNFTRPINGIITSRYGRRSSPGGIGSTNHKGLDIAAKAGTKINSATAGTVKFAGNKGSLGNLVIIDNGNGIETYYGHCSKIYVSKGQLVKAGDRVAAVGKTGAATGYHLHFEIHVNGKNVNPQKYIY